MPTPVITDRSWLLAQLDAAGAPLAALEAAGATNLEACWSVDDITVTARKHGAGVTITRATDGTEPVPPMKLLAGWLADPNGAS